MARAVALGSWWVCLVLAACGPDAVEPPGPPPTVPLYGPGPDTSLVPVPSDRYTIADDSTKTGLRLSLAGRTGDALLASYGDVVAQLEKLDGWSPGGGVAMSFSRPIDTDGLAIDPLLDPASQAPLLDASAFAAPDSPLVLLDIDPASPEYGTAKGLVMRWWSQPADGYYLEDEHTLVAQPAEPLRPSTRYAFFVTDALRDAEGKPLGASDETLALLGRSTDEPSDAPGYVERVRASLGELEAFGGDPDRVVLATVFTTASVTDELAAAAAAARAAPTPALVEPWTLETPVGAPDVRARFRAVYEAPELRRPKPAGTWEVEAGIPIVQEVVGLEAFLAFSDATQSGPRPLVVYQHGLGGTKDGSWGTAERLAELAERGVAVLAIDSPEHGSRSADGSAAQAIFSFFGVDLDTNTFDIERARDNFRQMAHDQLELVRLASSLGSLDVLPVGAPDGVPDVDPTQIVYIGHSFGSVQGPTVFALAPELDAAVWNVGGSGMMTLLRDSGLFSVLVNALKPPQTPDGALGRFLSLTQAIVDPGDSLHYARFAAREPFPAPEWRPRDVLVQEVEADGIVPNSTTEALARALGAVAVSPFRPVSGVPSAAAPLVGGGPGGATVALSLFPTMNGGEKAQHGELLFAPEGRAQYVEFLRSALARGKATVLAPYP